MEIPLAHGNYECNSFFPIAELWADSTVMYRFDYGQANISEKTKSEKIF